MKMTWWDHTKMLIVSFALVMLTLAMVITFIFANAALAQWRVDVNVARQELAERVLNNE